MSEFPDNQFVNRLGAVKYVFVGLLCAMGLIVALIVERSISSPFLLVVAVMLAMLFSVSVAYGIARLRGEKKKKKRGEAAQDTYAMIDRMVDDLDDDELAYLERRLNMRKKVDLTESVERLSEPHVRNRKR